MLSEKIKNADVVFEKPDPGQNVVTLDNELSLEADFNFETDLANVEHLKDPNYRYRWCRETSITSGKHVKGWEKDPSGITAQGMIFCRMPKDKAMGIRKRAEMKAATMSKNLNPEEVAARMGHGAKKYKRSGD